MIRETLTACLSAKTAGDRLDVAAAAAAYGLTYLTDGAAYAGAAAAAAAGYAYGTGAAMYE